MPQIHCLLDASIKSSRATSRKPEALHERSAEPCWNILKFPPPERVVDPAILMVYEEYPALANVQASNDDFRIVQRAGSSHWAVRVSRHAF
ncbi:hypothetical protein E2C01_002391 [Portunus trituberculatus]|uniref:Uncharacterized protein n=1 Tax=Portunus trituberculatus TaxID=210409 RepID=A0A5B7CQL2_PORTR|nr:hypothetical protein [Portunus trituberculatus]